MRIDFAAACDYALIDQYGKLSVLGIFHHIWVGSLPAVHPRLHLVLRLRGTRTEVGKHEIAISLVDEAGTAVITGNGTVNLSEPPAGVLEIEAGAILVFDVPFAKAGRYRFEITVDGSTRTEVPVSVAQRASSPGPAAGGLP